MMDETAEDIDQQRSDVPRGGPSSPHNPLLHSSSRKSRRTGNMLPFFPAPANVRSFNRIPGMQQTASNLSESTGGHTVDAFMAYEKYAEKTGIGTGDSDNDTVEQDSHSVQSRFSFSSSLHSRDTFSTSPAVGTKKATGGRFLPTPITRACCWHSKWAESIVKSRIFKRLSIFFILLNCTLCAVATSDWVTESFRRNRQFDTMKEIFVWITTTELVFQVLAHGPYLLTDGWLVFDLIVVGFSLTFHNFLVIRTFRVVRTLRLASWIKDLKQLVRALLLVIPKMFAISFLLMILFFVFAILFVDLFKHSYDNGVTSVDYFGSLQTAFFTLFQIMTLDDWSNICKELMKENSWAWAPVIAFVIVSSFFFLNLVIAVVCEAVTSVHRDTVVKYIQEDISAATCAREAIKVDDRLDEVIGSIQLLMQSQIALLEAIEIKDQHVDISRSNVQNQLEEHKAALRQELNESFFGRTIQSAALAHSARGNTAPIPRDVTLEMQQPTGTHYRSSAIESRGQDFGSMEYWATQGLSPTQIEKVLSAIEATKAQTLPAPVT